MRQLKISKSITNRQNASLDKYLQEIDREELITPEEEVILAKKIRNGDQVALEKMTKANLRFVVSVAKQYQHRGFELPDLINEGNLGLIKAAKRFDETRGFKFISYAVSWIRQSILQALAEQSRIVRLPLNKIGSINKLDKAISKLQQEHCCEPTIAEIALWLQVSESEVKDTMTLSGRHVSMDAPFHQADKPEPVDDWHEIIHSDSSTESGLVTESLQFEIERSLQTLTPREGAVVRFFLKEKTKHEIADKMNIVPERVRQINKKAIKRLKDPQKNKFLKTYLG